MKEQYGNISLELETLNYEEYSWKICINLKMVNFLLKKLIITTLDSYIYGTAATKTTIGVIVGERNIINPPLGNHERMMS